jgi:hypothetical protein
LKIGATALTGICGGSGWRAGMSAAIAVCEAIANAAIAVIERSKRFISASVLNSGNLPLRRVSAECGLNVLRARRMFGARAVVNHG